MDKTFVRASLAFLGGALAVALPAVLLRFQSVEQDPVAAARVAQLLGRLQKECAEDSPTNDYFVTMTEQPTERLREEILLKLAECKEPALREVRRQLGQRQDEEYGEMLNLVAMHLGDDSAEREVAELMVYSDHPAVRILAARLLRKAKPAFSQDYFLRALRDPRFVSNDGCAVGPEKYYPVRVIATLALRDMGVAVLTDGEREEEAARERAKYESLMQRLEASKR